MAYIHVTHKDNARSIERDGLRVDRATGVACAWLCNYPRLAWALRHVADHHGWKLTDMIAYRVDVPRHWLSRWYGRWGIYTCRRDIPAAMLAPKRL